MNNPVPAPATGKGPALAVVFGSGGARGWAHIGVLRAFRELGLRPDCVCGTSIGSIAAAVEAAGCLAQVEFFEKNLDWRKAALLFVEFGMHRSGLIEGRHVMDALSSLIPDVRIEELSIPYAAVAMDIASQHEVVFRSGSLLEAIRASISIPGLFTPRPYGRGRWLVDGGFVDPLPVNIARGMGAYRVVAVDVNLNMSAAGRRRKPATAATPQPVSAVRAPGGMRLRSRLLASIAAAAPAKFNFFDNDTRRAVEDLWKDMLSYGRRELWNANRPPTIADILVDALRAGENSITRERLLREPPDVLIQPAVGHIATLDFQCAPEAIDAGYAATMALADKLLQPPSAG